VDAGPADAEAEAAVAKAGAADVEAGATDAEPLMRRPEPLMRKAEAADVEVLGSKGGNTMLRDLAWCELEEPEVNPIGGEEEEDANAEKQAKLKIPS
jgi:hypothetical protein